jgi:hypothetical protein
MAARGSGGSRDAFASKSIAPAGAPTVALWSVGAPAAAMLSREPANPSLRHPARASPWHMHALAQPAAMR